MTVTQRIHTDIKDLGRAETFLYPPGRVQVSKPISQPLKKKAERKSTAEDLWCVLDDVLEDVLSLPGGCAQWKNNRRESGDTQEGQGCGRVDQTAGCHRPEEGDVE